MPGSGSTFLRSTPKPGPLRERAGRLPILRLLSVRPGGRSRSILGFLPLAAVILVYLAASGARHPYPITGIENSGALNNTGATAHDVDAAPDRLAFEHAGRYYIRVRQRSGVYTVSALPVP